MTRTQRTIRFAPLAALLAFALFGLPHLSFAAASGTGAQAPEGNPASSAAASRLNKKQFRDVKVSVDNGVATLTGTVDLYDFKADAEKRVRKAPGIQQVLNKIEVAGPTVPDDVLGANLAKKLSNNLTYSSPGGSIGSNSFSVHVSKGAVILRGHARSQADKDSAISLVSTYPGVKDVVSEIEVDAGVGEGMAPYPGVPSPSQH
jgi:hyperosmotically inducible periplasmic protein